MVRLTSADDSRSTKNHGLRPVALRYNSVLRSHVLARHTLHRAPFMIINLARRPHDHNWELDPITRSLLDTDFYKLLMLQFIWKHFRQTRASFSLINRSFHVRLADLIDIGELREQLEQTRMRRFHKSELIWLAGNTFYGRKGIFEPAFLEWLEKDFQLSEYELSSNAGQFSLTFRGLWTDTTLWEIYALSTISELKTRASLKRLSEFELDILYARAKTR